jgi:hypothetical protein
MLTTHKSKPQPSFHIACQDRLIQNFCVRVLSGNLKALFYYRGYRVESKDVKKFFVRYRVCNARRLVQ